MKNILKWFTVFFIVMIVVTGLEVAKFSLFRPPNMEHLADPKGGFGGGPPPWQNGPSPAFHPNRIPLGPPPAGIEWAFALADLIDLLVYVLVLLPLLYGAYLLYKRTLHVPRLNTTAAPILSSFKPDRRSAAESDQVSTQQGDYSMLDNHILDQLL